MTKELKDNKLFLVKYNCYKTIGYIYEEQNDTIEAIRYLVMVRFNDSIIDFMFKV